MIVTKEGKYRSKTGKVFDVVDVLPGSPHPYFRAYWNGGYYDVNEEGDGFGIEMEMVEYVGPLDKNHFMNKTDSIYIASPYSHSDKKVVNERVDLVTSFVAEMMKLEYVVYSPIVFGHAVATAHSLPVTWDYWKKYLSIQLKGHDVLLVLTLYGWEDSIGVREEILLAKSSGKPVLYAKFNKNTSEIEISSDGEKYLSIDNL